MKLLFEWFVGTAHAVDLVQYNPTPISATDPNAVFGIANNILAILTIAAYPIGFAAILYSAYLVITSAGKPESYGTAKKNLIYVLTGVFLIVFATVFIRFIRGLISF